MVTFEEEYKWDFDRKAMGFHARMDGRLVYCLVSEGALKQLRPHANAEDAFRQTRLVIENLAREKLERGHVVDGRVLIGLDDIPLT